MNYLEALEAAKEANITIENTDYLLEETIKLLPNRLRTSSKDYLTKMALVKIKKELKDFNATTLKWNN